MASLSYLLAHYMAGEATVMMTGCRVKPLFDFSALTSASGRPLRGEDAGGGNCWSGCCRAWSLWAAAWILACCSGPMLVLLRPKVLFAFRPPCPLSSACLPVDLRRDMPLLRRVQLKKPFFSAM